MKIDETSLIDEKPTLKDFKRDVNKHENARYAQHDEYVIEMERDLRTTDYEARLTVWRPQEKNGKAVPSDKDGVKYHWIIVGRRKFERYDGELPKNMAQKEEHLRETIERHGYDGPRQSLDVTVVND